MASESGDLPTTFGKYLLTERLATGGMAEIYLAKLVGPGGFEKQLVIKQIHRALSGQRQFVDLFVAEAKTLVTLAHGNIVPIYELGVVDDTYFIAMEYIDGPTLYRLTERAIQRDERIAPATAAWVCARLLEGLDYAHRKGDGVIHRDLSPRNVMLSRDGEVKLVDYGIAVAFGAESGEVESAPPTGSFPYMSPEQARRERLTPQTDVFSAGVLLWEMLVGQRLFARPSAEATLEAVKTAPIEHPSAKVAEVPDALDAIVMRALDRDLATRWPTAAAMLAPLQKYLYALAEAPGPRDLAALVARFCPPETRRLPTNLPVQSDDSDSEPPSPRPGGPSTVVVPRKPAAPVITSFATNVLVDKALGSEPPPLDDGSTRPPNVPPDRPPISLSVPGREPPSRGLLLFVGLGGVALTIWAVVIFARGRDAVLAQGDAGIDAAIPRDAARGLDASLDAAPPPDVPGDAAVAPHDAIVAVERPDAATARPAIDAAVVTGLLKIGADPWGEIRVDGVPRGRTPATITVPIGKHVVEVVFPGDGTPQTKTFPVEVMANETVPLQASFVAP